MNDPLAVINRDDCVGGDGQDPGEFRLGRAELGFGSLLRSEPRSDEYLLRDEKRRGEPGNEPWNQQVLSSPKEAPTAMPAERSRIGE